MRIFMDGRDPEIDGQPLPLPRRERRILEYLASNRGRRVTKTQVFNAIYGIFDDEVEENVVESHISKLRKKLRERLGFDPIDSKRFLGYRLDCLMPRGRRAGHRLRASFAQVQSAYARPLVHGKRGDSLDEPLRNDADRRVRHECAGEPPVDGRRQHRQLQHHRLQAVEHRILLADHPDDGRQLHVRRRHHHGPPRDQRSRATCNTPPRAPTSPSTANGFFVVQDAGGTPFLTRAGSFVPDGEGDLVNAAGFYLMGYSFANGTPSAVANGFGGLEPSRSRRSS